jgi:hypothetical protein
MHTRANITVGTAPPPVPAAAAASGGFTSADSRRGRSHNPAAAAVLTQGGVELLVELVEPEGAIFTSGAVDLKPPQDSSAGISKLMVQTSASCGKIVVAFSVKT